MFLSFLSFFLSFLVETQNQLNLTLSSARLLLSQTNSFKIQNFSSLDCCGRLLSSSNYFYHLSKEEVWQSWLASSNNPLAGMLDYSVDSTNTITNFDVSTTDDKLFLLNSVNRPKETMGFSLANGSPLWSFDLPYLYM